MLTPVLTPVLTPFPSSLSLPAFHSFKFFKTFHAIWNFKPIRFYCLYNKNLGPRVQFFLKMTFTVVLRISMSNVEEEKTENWFAYSSMMAHSEPDRNSQNSILGESF